MKEVTAYGRGVAPAPHARGLRVGRGFTTIELLIGLVVMGVLLALAFPSYQSSIRKSRRAEAFSALTAIQQAQERLRSNRETFATTLTAAVTATPPGLGWAPTATRTTGGYYDLTLSDINATRYVATATAVTGTSQDNDGACRVLAVRVDGGNIRYGSGSPPNWAAVDADPQRCWAR